MPVVVSRAALACRKCGCQRVHINERARRGWKSAPLWVTRVGLLIHFNVVLLGDGITRVVHNLVE